MKKVYYFIIPPAFLVLLAVTLVVVNCLMIWHYEHKRDSIRSEVLSNESLFNDVVGSVTKINAISEYNVYYDGSDVTAKQSNKDVSVRPELAAEIRSACEKLENPPPEIVVYKVQNRARFIYIIHRGLLHDYMQVELRYYEEMPEEPEGEILSDHWVFIVYGLI